MKVLNIIMIVFIFIDTLNLNNWISLIILIQWWEWKWDVVDFQCSGRICIPQKLGLAWLTMIIIV